MKKGLKTPTFHCPISGHNSKGVEGKDFERTHAKSRKAKEIQHISTAYYERIGWRAVCSCGCQWNFN
jgi:hypothetical protein